MPHVCIIRIGDQSLSLARHSLSSSFPLQFPNHWNPKRQPNLPFFSLSRHKTVCVMASNRDRDDPLTFANPSSSSSPITVSDHLDSFLADPSSHIGSASGSFQNEGLLADNSGSNIDAEFGFSRLDFRTNQLVGTVELYQRHVFLCYKNPQVWPPRIEAAEFDRLPRLLSAAVMARKGDMKKEVCDFVVYGLYILTCAGFEFGGLKLALAVLWIDYGLYMVWSFADLWLLAFSFDLGCF